MIIRKKNAHCDRVALGHAVIQLQLAAGVNGKVGEGDTDLNMFLFDTTLEIEASDIESAKYSW